MLPNLCSATTPAARSLRRNLQVVAAVFGVQALGLDVNSGESCRLAVADRALALAVMLAWRRQLGMW